MNRQNQAGSRKGMGPWKTLDPFCIGVVQVCLLISLCAAPVSVAASEIPYKMTIEGISDRGLVKEMRSVSDMEMLQDRPPQSLRLLHRRAERDRGRFIQLLRSRSYYGARVDIHTDPASRPVRVVFRVKSGPAYLLKSVDFKVDKSSPVRKIRFPKKEQIGLVLDRPAESRTILEAGKALQRHMGKQGFPFPKISKRQVVVDHATHGVSVRFTVDTGPQVAFGPTEITGLKGVKESVVRRRITWREGEPYNGERLEAFRKRLMEMGLFAAVQVAPGELLDEKGRIPVTVSLTERKHRSVGAGIGYRTDEGPGGKISWEHRNLFRSGEQLGFSATVSDYTINADANYRKPYFIRDDQSLRATLRLAEDDPAAYTSRNLTTGVSVDRRLKPKIIVGLGPAFKASRVEQFDKKSDFRLLSLPMHFEWDWSDDLLDPTRGGRFATRITPYYNFHGDSFGFVKAYAHYRHYVQIFKKPLAVVAGRLALGSIVGADRDTIPADERLYAGGGGSVRGYAFQLAGPLRGKDPVGGRSLLELSVELRMKITDSLGFVAFLDGGSSFEASAPDFEERFQWGAGVGLRYFTRFGPFRLDVGIPLNPRRDVDDPFQIYVSLGQAF
jgi:translocation and assembly module TamA